MDRSVHREGLYKHRIDRFTPVPPVLHAGADRGAGCTDDQKRAASRTGVCRPLMFGWSSIRMSQWTEGLSFARRVLGASRVRNAPAKTNKPTFNRCPSLRYKGKTSFGPPPPESMHSTKCALREVNTKTCTRDVPTGELSWEVNSAVWHYGAWGSGSYCESGRWYSGSCVRVPLGCGWKGAGTSPRQQRWLLRPTRSRCLQCLRGGGGIGNDPYPT